jgi:alkaline phosphatase
MIEVLIEGTDIDLIMGAGHPEYDNDGGPTSFVDTYVNPADWAEIDDGGDPDNEWDFFDDKDDIINLATKDDWPEDYISDDVTCPYSIVPRYFCVAPVHDSLQYDRTGAANDVPSLAQMTESALNILKEDPDGFFLLVEGGSIQTACEDDDFTRMDEEIKDFGDAVEAVINWVDAEKPNTVGTNKMTWDNTILIVTADQETGYLWGPGSNPGWVLIDEADPSTSQFYNAVGSEISHTNSLVPIWAWGTGWENLEDYADETDDSSDNPYGPRSYLDNTALGEFLLWAVQFHRQPDPDPDSEDVCPDPDEE